MVSALYMGCLIKNRCTLAVIKMHLLEKQTNVSMQHKTDTHGIIKTV